MTKSELRTTYLQMRSDLSGDELTVKSRQIADRFFLNIDLKTIRLLHIFISIQKLKEIETSYIYERIWREFEQIKMVVPRVDFESGEIKSVELTPNSEFIENVWGIREPTNGERIAAADIDFVLVPLLCFDKRGYRVGYGKGFYDRFLSKCRPDCLKVGLSYFPPVDIIDDVSETDVKLDMCVTPEAILTTKKIKRE